MKITINTTGGVVNIYPSETHIGEGELDEMEISEDTAQDEDQAHWFKEGWDACLRETMLRFVAGTLPEFYNEMGAVHDSGQAEDLERARDPHHNEPEGTGEAPVARKVTDSGEPELEHIETAKDGIWTISDEELQGRLDAEFQRGLAYSSPTTGARYLPEEIRAIEERAAKREPLKFAAIRGAFDRAVAEVEEEVRADEEREEMEGTPMGVRAVPDRTNLVLTALFRQLGIEVVR